MRRWISNVFKKMPLRYGTRVERGREGEADTPNCVEDETREGGLR